VKNGEQKMPDEPTQSNGGALGARIRNLPPWRRGVSANPGGRQKDTPIKDEIRSAATPEKIKKIVAKVMEMAEAGDLKAVEFLRLHLDGQLPRPSREDSHGKGGNVVLISGPDQLRQEPQSTSQTLPELPDEPK
jgi:hypothetical protein